MRTIRIKLYKFSELSDKAKETALNNYRNKGYNDGSWEEIKATVKEVCELFDLKTGRQWDDIKTGHIGSDIMELQGLRLYKYLVNNYYNDLFKPAYIKSIDRPVKWKQLVCKVRKDYKGNEYTQLYSKQKRDNSCVLTGWCFDMDILDPVYKFLARPDKSTTFEDLMQDIGNAISKTFRDEEEWVNSDEYITDIFEANEYEFKEDGTIY